MLYPWSCKLICGASWVVFPNIHMCPILLQTKITRAWLALMSEKAKFLKHSDILRYVAFDLSSDKSISDVQRLKGPIDAFISVRPVIRMDNIRMYPEKSCSFDDPKQDKPVYRKSTRSDFGAILWVKSEAYQCQRCHVIVFELYPILPQD